MTEQTVSNILIAFFAVVPPTIAAGAAFLQSWSNGKKSDQIHVLVNSNLNSVKAELAAAKIEIGDLRAMVVRITAEKP